MSSAIQNLQKAILDPSQSLTQLLRQTKIIAADLTLTEVEKWVDLELKGYPDEIEPPEYREFVTDRLMMHNPYRGGWLFVGDATEKMRAIQSIAEIENLSKQDSVAYAPAKPYEIMDSFGSTASSAWPQRVTVNPGQFKDILEAVRNELLQLTTELRKRGIQGEDMNFDDKEKQAAGSMIFNIGTLHGMAGNIASSQVTLYEFSSVQHLIDKRIPKEERREFEDIMDDLKTATPEQKPSLVKRGEKWIVKHKDILGTGVEILTKAIKGGG